MKYLFFVWTIVAVLYSVQAQAQIGAREHFLAGQDYYTQGRYQKAIEEFKEAYRLDPKPLLLYNLAQAYEKLGQLQEAVDHIERYLEADPKTDQRVALLSKVENLKARISNTGITVNSNVEGAAVYVDESLMGETPINGVLSLAPGAHKVRIAKDGYRDFVMNVAVSTGHSVPVEANLEPGQNDAPVGPVTGDKPVTRPVGTESEIGAGDVIPWVIAGVGAAAAITGLGVIGGIAKSNNDHELAKVADIVGWPGVALAVGGTVWGIINVAMRKKDEREAAVVVLPIVDRHSAQLAASIRF